MNALSSVTEIDRCKTTGAPKVKKGGQFPNKQKFFTTKPKKEYSLFGPNKTKERVVQSSHHNKIACRRKTIPATSLDDDRNCNDGHTHKSVHYLSVVISKYPLVDGLCQKCGFQLANYVTERSKKVLDIKGSDENGECITCNRTINVEFSGKNSIAATEAVAPISLGKDNHGLSQPHHPTIVAVRPVIDASTNLTKAIYKGDFNMYGERHGEGEITWSNGDRFVGKFYNGVREEQGTLFFHDGGKYFGWWKNDKMSGINSTRSFPNGDSYVGEYYDGKRHGQGTFYFANGDQYAGTFEDSQLQGFGRYYHSTGSCFEGMFVEGKRHGLGKFEFANGSLDVSLYSENKATGIGVRWNVNRKRAWKLVDGQVKTRVNLAEASDIAQIYKLL